VAASGIGVACAVVAAVLHAVASFGNSVAQVSLSMVGTAIAARTDAAEIKLKPENGAAVLVKVGPRTVLQRVAPGAKDLSNAESITLGDIAAGDRLLVTVKPGLSEALRVVVMAGSAIAARNEADRLGWVQRGVSGVVVEKKGNEIALRMRSFVRESRVTVLVQGSTTYRRYAPDSARFADARPSSFAEISVGDQLRARGQKSEDGLRVVADEVVFGTFLTRAGSVTAVNAEAGEITVKEWATNKPLVVTLTAHSQLKKLVEFRSPSGGPESLAPGPGGPPDIPQMLEHLPAAKPEALKPGETIVVCGTKGAHSGQITAITLVANAGMLLQMASMASRGEWSAGSALAGGMSMDALLGGLEGLELSGIIPSP